MFTTKNTFFAHTQTLNTHRRHARLTGPGKSYELMQMMCPIRSSKTVMMTMTTTRKSKSNSDLFHYFWVVGTIHAIQNQKRKENLIYTHRQRRVFTWVSCGTHTRRFCVHSACVAGSLKAFRSTDKYFKSGSFSLKSSAMLILFLYVLCYYSLLFALFIHFCCGWLTNIFTSLLFPVCNSFIF